MHALELSYDADAFNVRLENLDNQHDFALKGMRRKLSRKLKRKELGRDIKQQGRKVADGIGEFATGLHDGIIGLFYRLKIASSEDIPSPKQLVVSVLFVRYLLHVHEHFTFDKKFHELASEFVNSAGDIEVPRCLVYAHAIADTRRDIAVFEGQLEGLQDQLRNARQLTDQAERIAAETEIQTLIDQATFDLDTARTYLRALSDPNGSIKLSEITNPQRADDRADVGPLNIQAMALDATKVGNPVWKYGMLYVLKPMYKSLYLGNWTSKDIEKFMDDLMAPENHEVMRNLFMAAFLHRFRAWPKFFVYWGLNAWGVIPHIVKHFDQEGYALNRRNIFGRLFYHFAEECRIFQYRAILTAPDGRAIVDIIIGEVRTLGVVTNHFIAFMRREMRAQGNNAFKIPFDEYSRKFITEMGRMELSPRWPIDNLRLRTQPNLRPIIWSLKIVFWREMHKYIWLGNGKTEADIMAEIDAKLADADTQRNLRDLLFQRRHFAFFIFQSHRPWGLGGLDSDRNILFRKYFHKVPYDVKKLGSFYEVAQLLARRLAEKRQAEAAKAEKKKRKGAKPFEGELYWMFFAFAKEDDVMTLNEHGEYPRVFSKADLARYIEGKQKDVDALLSNSKEDEGRAVGNFLGASGLTEINTFFADTVADNNDWKKFPIVGLGAAVSHVKDRELATTDPEAYARLSPYELHWKWHWIRHGPSDEPSPSTILGRVVVWEDGDQGVKPLLGLTCSYEDFVNLKVELSDEQIARVLQAQGIGVDKAELKLIDNATVEPEYEEWTQEDGHFELRLPYYGEHIELLAKKGRTHHGLDPEHWAPHVEPVEGQEETLNDHTGTFRRYFALTEQDHTKENVIVVVQKREAEQNEPKLLVYPTAELENRKRSAHKTPLAPVFGPEWCEANGVYRVPDAAKKLLKLMSMGMRNSELSFTLKKSGEVEAKLYFILAYRNGDPRSGRYSDAFVNANDSKIVMLPSLHYDKTRSLYPGTSAGSFSFGTLTEQAVKITNNITFTPEIAVNPRARKAHYGTYRLICVACKPGAEAAQIQPLTDGIIRALERGEAVGNENLLWDVNYIDFVLTSAAQVTAHAAPTGGQP